MKEVSFHYKRYQIFVFDILSFGGYGIMYYKFFDLNKQRPYVYSDDEDSASKLPLIDQYSLKIDDNISFYHVF